MYIFVAVSYVAFILVINMYLPSSTAFFQGQTDAANGLATPKQPSSFASYDEKMYFRGFMQQQRKMTKMAETQSFRVDAFALAS